MSALHFCVKMPLDGKILNHEPHRVFFSPSEQKKQEVAQDIECDNGENDPDDDAQGIFSVCLCGWAARPGSRTLRGTSRPGAISALIQAPPATLPLLLMELPVQEGALMSGFAQAIDPPDLGKAFPSGRLVKGAALGTECILIIIIGFAAVRTPHFPHGDSLPSRSEHTLS